MTVARRKLELGILPAALALLLLAGCGAASERPQPAAPAPSAATEKPLSDRALRAVEAEANRILDGGPEAFERRLNALRGHPVVVNQWASWCGPCRFEFPFFQELATGKHRGSVAFLGVNSEDDRDAAETFLEEYWVPYPHYFDPDTEVARLFKGGRAWPTTAFYDAKGNLVYTKLGGYASKQELDAEIRRYALGD